ncbi:MAG: hypothetical protein QOJ29_5142 [Thermoleophilaceae bacterium]|nr:hypothetical protein [Thermoleophilaceae bacterium]
MPSGERLDTARVFERVFAIYRAQAGVLLPAGLIIYLIPASLVMANSIWPQLAASFICTVFYQGLAAQAVRDIQDETRDLSLTGLFRSVGPAFAQLLWTALLVLIGVALGSLAFLIPGLVLGTMWAVAVPAVVYEVRTAPQALSRSAQLVRGQGWRVFGILLVTVLILFVADGALAAAATGISGSKVVLAVGNLISSALTAPMLALASAVLYLELVKLKGEPPPPADMASFNRER